MNEVYLGQSGDNEIRLPLASLYYFGRPVEELSLDQQGAVSGYGERGVHLQPVNQPNWRWSDVIWYCVCCNSNKLLIKNSYDMLSARPLGRSAARCNLSSASLYAAGASGAAGKTGR